MTIKAEKKHKITLIGMSGVGKTTIGRKLAKQLKVVFMDTDHILEQTLNQTLHQYIKSTSQTQFLETENKIIAALELPEKAVISTGGSVIYATDAMRHLKAHSTVIYLKDSFEHILQRIPNIETRGIVSPEPKSFKEIYEERLSLYEKSADISLKVPYPFNIYRAISHIKHALKKLENEPSYH